jgi:uncharacterized protein YjiS (DUF1127 family)
VYKTAARSNDRSDATPSNLVGVIFDAIVKEFFVSTIIHANPDTGERKSVSRLGLPQRAARWIGNRLARRRGERGLLELSDHVLKDLGLSRCNVRYSAEFGRGEGRAS